MASWLVQAGLRSLSLQIGSVVLAIDWSSLWF
jgi:hypothetical protein